MAGYFSNHSQSRFLANSSQTATQQPANQRTPPAAGAPDAATHQANPSHVARRLPSKHFSTSVVERDAERADGAVTNGGLHPLRHTWVFWFRQQRSPGDKIASYEEGIKKISTCGSVESFWSLWTHLYPPSALLPTTDYLLFHSGVRRPVWEDPLNLPGGKWIVRLRKGVADRIWEDLVLAILGEQFQFPPEDGRDVGAPEICGATISVRQSEDIVSVWNRDGSDARLRERIRDAIRRVLNLHPTTVMEYKSNNDSMQDKSSFRTSTADRTPVS